MIREMISISIVLVFLFYRVILHRAYW